jgi:hypothetical protein
MHWLYFNEKSPLKLEEAGAAYDSTVGYRETTGYKSGTTQVYRLPATERMLELPMHAMDTALFSPVCLGLSLEEATERMERLANRAQELGGCVTVNWHDRSLAPERLWHQTYRDTVEYLKAKQAWFATARQAVAWFRKRRAVVFETETDGSQLAVRVTGEHAANLPGLRLRIHEARRQTDTDPQGGAKYIDRYFDQELPAEVLCLAN